MFIYSNQKCNVRWGNSVQKANRLYNHHLSEEIKSKLINLSDSYSEMRSWLICNYGGVSRIVSDILRDLSRKPKPSSNNSNALFSFFAYVSGALQRLERLSKVSGIDKGDLEACLFSRSTLSSLSLVLPNQTHADWITEMTKAGLDYKNPVGKEAYKIFKDLCIIERNKSEGRIFSLQLYIARVRACTAAVSGTCSFAYLWYKESGRRKSLFFILSSQNCKTSTGK